jgi:hypothetical protein
MSVFKVFHGGGITYDHEFEGTKVAGRAFHDYWTAATGAPQLFEDFIIGLIEDHGCTVTYKDEGTVVAVRVTGSAKHLYYAEGKNYRQINCRAERDNPNVNAVSMAVPSVAADPDTGDTAAYLGDAVAKLSDPSIGLAEKRAFLLGLLLLKRCR